MKLKQLFTDDDAVSPVIGVILMVAITVILAAVIGAFVLDIGNQQEQTPQASLSMESGSTSGEVLISHDGGDSLNSGDFRVTANGSEAVSDWPSSDLSPGGSETVDASSASGVNDGDSNVNIVIVHKPSGGVLAEGTVDI